MVGLTSGVYMTHPTLWFWGFWASALGSEPYKNHPWIQIAHPISQSSIPSRKFTYPTWGSSENHLQRCLISTYQGDMFIPRRVTPKHVWCFFPLPAAFLWSQETWNHPWPQPTNGRRYGDPPTSVWTLQQLMSRVYLEPICPLVLPPKRTSKFQSKQGTFGVPGIYIYRYHCFDISCVLDSYCIVWY